MPFNGGAGMYAGKRWPTRAAGVRYVAMIGVRTRWSFTISTHHARILESPAGGIHGAGARSVRSWASVLSCAPTAIERFTPGCSFHRKLWLKHRVNSGKPTSGDHARHGNPERSLPKGQRVGRNVQRLEAEEPIQ